MLTGLLAAIINTYQCRYDIAVVGVANVICDIGVVEATAARMVLTRMNIGAWSRFVMRISPIAYTHRTVRNISLIKIKLKSHISLRLLKLQKVEAICRFSL